MAREMKDSGIEWIGEIPKEWEIRNIRNMFSFGKGLSITKENLREQGIAVVSYGQIHSKKNRFYEMSSELIRFVDESYLETNEQSLVNRGDFIFADTSEDVQGCGNFVYVDRQQVLFAGYHTIILRSLTQKDNKFLAFLFMSDCWRRQIRECVNGVKLFSVSQKLIKKTNILIPSEKERVRIANYLEEYCAAIDNVLEKTRASIEEYKRLKQAVITQAVTKGIRSNREMKDSGIEWIGKIPVEWKISQVKYALKWKSEKGQPQEEVLSLYRDYGIVPKDSRDDNHNVTSLDTSGYKVVDIGDFVINKMKAWQGSMAVSEYRGIISPAYHVCEFINDKFNKKYFHYLMRNKSYIPEYTRLSTGMRVGQWDLGFDDFKNIPILLPSQKEQKEIVNYLDQKCSAIDALIAKKEQYLSEIENYKKSLIYEYVTGKKEVPREYQV